MPLYYYMGFLLPEHFQLAIHERTGLNCAVSFAVENGKDQVHVQLEGREILSFPLGSIDTIPDIARKLPAHFSIDSVTLGQRMEMVDFLRHGTAAQGRLKECLQRSSTASAEWQNNDLPIPLLDRLADETDPEELLRHADMQQFWKIFSISDTAAAQLHRCLTQR